MNDNVKVPFYLYLLPMLAGLLVWQAYTAGQPNHQFIFASPEQVVLSLTRLSSSGELFRHAGITLLEAIVGFILGTTCGAALGLSLWYSRIAAKVAQPYLTALASVPVFALAPVIIVWFGIGITSKIAIAFLSTVVLACVQSYQGAMSVEERFTRLMQVMGASRFQTFHLVVVPSALIWVLNAMKLNIGLSLLGAFIGEFISSEEGLGYMIVKASGLYDMATVFVGVASLIVISLLLTGSVTLLERRLMRWKFAAAK
jgi:NitT/TauT family transport system permease protein